MAGIIVGALHGESKEHILAPLYNPFSKTWGFDELHPDVLHIAQGSYKRKHEHNISGKGWVISTLEAALWAFYTTDTFKDGLLKVVNLGDDADTTGAVYGQIAGAYYGIHNIPESWVRKTAKASLIATNVKTLHTMCS